MLVAGARATDQRRRDRQREIVTLRLPRGLAPDQMLAIVRTVIGLSPARSGLVGRDSVVFEVVGSRAGITHRLRLPSSAAAYVTAQLRAIVPGLAVTEVADFAPERCRRSLELRRQLTDAGLATGDVMATGRTILAALGGLGSGETAVWQLVVTGGIAARPPATTPLWRQLWSGQTPAASTPRTDPGLVGAALRLGAVAPTDRRAGELTSRLRRAAGTVAAPGARLVSRVIPSRLVAGRITRGATPLFASPVQLRPEELAALLGWPVGSPLIPGLDLGGSPQLPAAMSVPRTGRILGRSTADDRVVAQSVRGAQEHTLVLAPTGAGKTWFAAGVVLGDVAAGRGGLVIDPNGVLADAVLDRLPDSAIGRTVVIDPTDTERPVPLPLLGADTGGIPELGADALVTLLRHRYRDLGPRSTDILSSSLYALARMPDATLMDLLRLWGDPRYRSLVAGRSADDPVLAAFFAWFDGLGAAERNFILAAPLNKIRPLLQRPVVRNVLAAPRSTFSIAQALREELVVIVRLSEGTLGSDATSLLGQVVLARLWAAVQARPNRQFFGVTIDEAPRFLDQPTDLGEMLARSRTFGVGITAIAQSLGQFPPALRETVLANARTKLVFGTSATDATRLAKEFGPGVTPDFLTGLGRYEAMGAVSLGGTVSPPFTFATDALGPVIPGRAKAVRAASRERFGVPRAEIEASFTTHQQPGPDTAGPVGRRSS